MKSGQVEVVPKRRRHRPPCRYAHDFTGGLALVTTRQDEHVYFDGKATAIRELHFDPPRTLKICGGDKDTHPAGGDKQ